MIFHWLRCTNHSVYISLSLSSNYYSAFSQIIHVKLQCDIINCRQKIIQLKSDKSVLMKEMSLSNCWKNRNFTPLALTANGTVDKNGIV